MLEANSRLLEPYTALGQRKCRGSSFRNVRLSGHLATTISVASHLKTDEITGMMFPGRRASEKRADMYLFT